MNNNLKISILIPCHNEEKSIRSCVMSCLNQTRKADQIVVVNDGSTDNSANILKTFGKKITVVNIYPATGNKSYAQERGLRYIQGDVFIATDGDTLMDPGFVARIYQDFQDEAVAAVGGYVRSLPYNWLTAVRAFDYVIGQNIHKLAQSQLNFMLVIPGAAGAFRTKIFQKYVGFDHDTLTEDLDFTYKLHKHRQKILYDKKAVVYTQDPVTLNSYINQMRRWHGGGWQNLKKHLSLDLLNEPGRVLELSLTYIEGLIFSSLLFVIPLANLIFALQILLFIIVMTTIQAIYVAIVEKRKDILLVPFRYIAMMYINGWIFIEQFITVIILGIKNKFWFQPDRVSI